jgi:hypothetical protein
MNAKLHSTSSVSQSMRIASYVYICTVIREMYILCENYISCSEKQKKNPKEKQLRETCRKLALQLKKIYICVGGGGAHHTIFTTGPLVPTYATDSIPTYVVVACV